MQRSNAARSRNRLPAGSWQTASIQETIPHPPSQGPAVTQPRCDAARFVCSPPPRPGGRQRRSSVSSPRPRRAGTLRRTQVPGAVCCSSMCDCECWLPIRGKAARKAWTITGDRDCMTCAAMRLCPRVHDGDYPAPVHMPLVEGSLGPPVARSANHKRRIVKQSRVGRVSVLPPTPGIRIDAEVRKPLTEMVPQPNRLVLIHVHSPEWMTADIPPTKGVIVEETHAPDTGLREQYRNRCTEGANTRKHEMRAAQLL